MPNASHQPTPLSRRPFGQNYAFVVVAVIFLALLSSAGLRATPGVLMLPLQTAFGWNVGVISSSAAIGIFLYGLAGPFAAAVMQRFGIRRNGHGISADRCPSFRRGARRQRACPFSFADAGTSGGRRLRVLHLDSDAPLFSRLATCA
jgi:hypothetical protein